jgi:hypothetical protein
VRHPRFHLHFTPTYSSWMNLVWVRRADHQVAQAGHSSIDQRARGVHHHLGGSVERGAQTLRLAQERRRDPRHALCLLRANY